MSQERQNVYEAVKRGETRALGEASESLRRDASFVLSLVQYGSRVLEHAHATLLRDMEFMSKAMKRCVWCFDFADEALKEDKAFVKATVRTHPDLFNKWTLPLRMRVDKDVAASAVSASVDAVHSLHDTLFRDKEFLTAVMCANHSHWQSARLILLASSSRAWPLDTDLTRLVLTLYTSAVADIIVQAHEDAVNKGTVSDNEGAVNEVDQEIACDILADESDGE
jgi:hypothetical protein